MVPRRIGEILGRPFSALLCCTPADLLLAERRRSQLCSRAVTSRAWVLLLHCPIMRQSSSVTASALLCWSVHSSDSLCSGSNLSSGVRMSSSTSNSDEQGKAKSKSQIPKRGSLQSNTSPVSLSSVTSVTNRDASVLKKGRNSGVEFLPGALDWCLGKRVYGLSVCCHSRSLFHCTSGGGYIGRPRPNLCGVSGPKTLKPQRSLPGTPVSLSQPPVDLRTSMEEKYKELAE
ncbi:hypothetical protein GOODEAATRI_007877, partial [Goodea atripinnis]